MSKKQLQPTGLAKDVLNRMEQGQKPQKVPKTLNLTLDIFNKFSEACEALGTKPSPVIDHLMQRFLDDLKK